MSQEQNTTEREIVIPLPSKYWTVILAALEPMIQSCAKRIEELRKQNTDINSLPGPIITALIGPVLTRGIIVKALVAEGEMNEEANDEVGIDVIMEKVQEAREKHKK